MTSEWKNKDFRDKKKRQSQVNWRNKRKKKYDQTVWKGWRESEKPSEIVTYHISELEEKE